MLHSGTGLYTFSFIHLIIHPSVKQRGDMAEQHRFRGAGAPCSDATKPLTPAFTSLAYCTSPGLRASVITWAGKMIQKKNKLFILLWELMKGDLLPHLVHCTGTQGFALIPLRRWYRGRNNSTGNSTLQTEICTSQDFLSDKTMNCTVSPFCIK